jgi:glucosamine--fructose-6-phosphate aminotransferase (isomerizing)
MVGNLLDSTEMRKKTKELATILKDDQSLLCIGKGAGLQSAREAALKLKEICYIHAEAIGSGDLKHGPISLIDCINKKSFKIILFIFDDDRLDEMSLSLDQVNAREAYSIVITDCYYKLDKAKIDYCIEVQSANFLSKLLALVPVQLLCLEIANLREINPDKPRNLAKTVTVN